MTNSKQYKKARKKVEAKIGFYTHLCVYMIVNTGLLLMNLGSPDEYIWSKWPLLGWGIGIFFHGIKVFMIFDGSKFKERMIEKELNKC